MSVAIVCMINNTALREIDAEAKALMLNSSSSSSEETNSNQLNATAEITDEVCAFQASNSTGLVNYQ